MTTPADSSRKSRNNSSLYLAAPWIIFGLLAVLAFAAFAVPARYAAARHNAAVALNKQLALPEDFPLNAAPLFAGATVKKAEKSSTTSKDGLPMDEWDVEANSAAEPKDIYEFYRDFCVKKDMLQTEMISIPTGYALDYANDKEIIHVETERHTGAKTTSLKLTYYVLTKKK